MSWIFLSIGLEPQITSQFLGFLGSVILIAPVLGLEKLKRNASEIREEVPDTSDERWLNNFIADASDKLAQSWKPWHKRAYLIGVGFLAISFWISFEQSMSWFS